MTQENSQYKNTKQRSRQNSHLSQYLGKLPPQAVDLEEAILGAMMLETEAVLAVEDILQPDSFYVSAHQEIYKAILELSKVSQPIDILTVTQQLRKLGRLESVGGAGVVAKLTANVNAATNVEYYARAIAELAIKRSLIRLAAEVQKDAYEDNTDVFELLDYTEQQVFSISEGSIGKKTNDLKAVISESLKELESKKDQEHGFTGVPSGLHEVDKVTGGWQNSDLVILAARPAMGKCLGIDTPVLMYDGSIKKVQNIQVGDLLMGDNSTPRRVLSLARGKEKMYWIRQNRGMDYRVNESHILSLKRSRNEGKHRNGDILDISVKDYITKSPKFQSNYKGYKVEVEFKEKKLPIEPYFLGLWLGDGKSTDVRIYNKDTEVIDYLEEYANNLNMTVSVGDKDRSCSSYSIRHLYSNNSQKSKTPQSILRKLKLYNNKHIPQKFLINSTANRLKLLAGLVDSDGYYDPVSNGYEITQKNKALAQQIEFLCNSLGFRTSFNSKVAKIKSTGFETEVYRVRFYGDTDRIPVKIPRKKCVSWKSKINWKQTGIKVEEDKVDNYYGFTLDGNHRFLLADMTVTHNTAMSLSILRNAAVDYELPVAIFSLEMSALQLVNRLISAEAELQSEKIRTGMLTNIEWQQLYSRIEKLQKAQIFIDDTAGISIMELRAKVRRLKAKYDIQLLVVDYLQLMTGGGNTNKMSIGNREQEIAFISRSLKNIAKEVNIPVIALSQLSRAVETRGGDKRPQLSDLRESGSLEQDADMVLFLYRPEYYGLTQDAEGNSTANMAELMIAKNRNGATRDIKLKFIGQYTKFDNLEPDNFAFDGDFGGEVTLGSKINNPLPPKNDENLEGGENTNTNNSTTPNPDDPPF